MANCENCTVNCGEKSVPEKIPYIVHEAAMDRAERHTKRWMITSFALIAILSLFMIGLLLKVNLRSHNCEEALDGIAIDGEINEETLNEPTPDNHPVDIP